MGGEVGALAWSPDARYLAGGNALQVWQRDGSDITVAPTTGGYKTSVVWSPDGRVFVAGTDRGLLIVRGQNGTALAMVKKHGATINQLAWSPDGNLLATASDDQTIHLINTTTLISS